MQNVWRKTLATLQMHMHAVQELQTYSPLSCFIYGYPEFFLDCYSTVQGAFAALLPFATSGLPFRCTCM